MTGFEKFCPLATSQTLKMTGYNDRKINKKGGPMLLSFWGLRPSADPQRGFVPGPCRELPSPRPYIIYTHKPSGVYKMQENAWRPEICSRDRWGILQHSPHNPSSSSRQYPSYGCLLSGGKRGDYQNCSVLYCVLKLCTVMSTLPPSPPLDNIRVMVIVWRLRGNIIRTAPCWVQVGCVTQCSQSAAHLCEQFLQVQQIRFVTLGPLRHA